jgi:hypothetical protein
MELNDDIIFSIFNYLDKKETVEASFVCKQFYQIFLNRLKKSKDYFFFDGSFLSIQALCSRNDYIKKILYSQINDSFFYIFPDRPEKIKFINCTDIDLFKISNKNSIQKICLIDSKLNIKNINLENIFSFFPNLKYIFFSNENKILLRNGNVTVHKKKRKKTVARN